MIHGLPEKLKDLRMKQGFSQREVASQLDLSPAIISSYETGDRTPSVEVLLALSYLYHCSTDYLLGKENTIPTTLINTDGLSTRQVHAIAELIRSMQEGN